MAPRRWRPGRKVADHRSDVDMCPVIEFNDWRADIHSLIHRGQQMFDVAGARRGNLDHRLFGFDRNQRRVGDHVIAFRDVPGDDFGVLQTFAQIGEVEDGHA